MLQTKEFYELIEEFENSVKNTANNLPYIGGSRFEKEPKEQWISGYIYSHGNTNDAFKFFAHGYSLGKCVGRLE